MIETNEQLIEYLRLNDDEIYLPILGRAADALQSQAAEIAHWKEQAALWKQSEETASRQHDKREAEIARLREALERNKQGWENAIELGLLPVQHRQTAHDLIEETRAALSEATDAQ